MPGLTAYAGLLNIGLPKPGETLVVAAAAGPVGSAVGQIGKIKGCRVVGIAGGQKKVDYLKNELGFDAAVDHRSPRLKEELKAACPDGIDIYFENVGGAVWDAVFPLLNNFARVPVCGLVANYNATSLPEGPDRSAGLMAAILTKRLRVQGFIVYDFAHQTQEFLQEMQRLGIREGKLKYREDIVRGLENAPGSVHRPFEGRKFRQAAGEGFGLRDWPKVSAWASEPSSSAMAWRARRCPNRGTAPVSSYPGRRAGTGGSANRHRGERGCNDDGGAALRLGGASLMGRTFANRAARHSTADDLSGYCGPRRFRAARLEGRLYFHSRRSSDLGYASISFHTICLCFPLGEESPAAR